MMLPHYYIALFDRFIYLIYVFIELLISLYGVPIRTLHRMR